MVENRIALRFWLLLQLVAADWIGTNGTCSGEAFKRLPATSLAECQASCEQEHLCKGVSYDRYRRACALLRIEGKTGARCYSEHPVEVYVMMPLDLVSLDGVLQQERLDKIWAALKTSGADGFMVDVWWGITEPEAKTYRFGAYKSLIQQAKQHGFKAQVVSSFHQCGNNVGDECYIPLPDFVRRVPGIWYQDAKGTETQEYISLFADNVTIGDRTALQMYHDWFQAFEKAFRNDLGETIVEIMVGLGPCGELRYPSYPLDRWNFPGIGSFQCFDDHALSSLRTVAGPDATPPHVDYNAKPEETRFFSEAPDNYASPAGRVFLEWYSSSLLHHAASVLPLARQAFPKVRLAVKISGIHWWYDSPSHAAEVTAGYYNTNGHNAYAEVSEALHTAGADIFDFTCLEMGDDEQPLEAHSSPQHLIHQSLQAAQAAGLLFAGENALPRYDQHAYDQVLTYKEKLFGFTYLRMTDTLMQAANLQRFRRFVRAMKGLPPGPAQRLERDAKQARLHTEALLEDVLSSTRGAVISLLLVLSWHV